MSERKTTLIVGGTGKTGRRVAARLVHRGQRVRVASRSAATPFDWSNPSGWGAVLENVRKMYLAYHPDLASPGAASRLRQLSALAVASGVERIVLLSGRGEPQAIAGEDAVRQSGVGLTVLRCAFFCQNFSEGFLVPNDGVIAFPAGDVAEPFVDADDIADVAVAALTDDTHESQIYELCGPRLVTFAEAAYEITEASGRAIRYVPVSFEEYASALAPHLPSEEVTFYVDLFKYVLDGHNAHLSDGVERAIKRKPRDFRDYARTAAAAAAWKS